MARASFALGWRRLLALALLTLALGAASAAPAQAAVTVNDRVSISGQDFSDCFGEALLYEGTVHVLGTLTEDERGGLHFRGRVMIHADAVGVDSGATYRIDSIFGQVSVNTDSDGATRTFSAQVITHAIRLGEGSDGDFWDRGIFRFTVNANGEVTGEVSLLDGGCERP